MTQKVVLIDSDVSFTSALRAGLEQAGYEVTEISDGRTAVDTLKALQPDFIYLSVEQDCGQNGYVICNRIKRTAALKELPLVIGALDSSGFAQHQTLKGHAAAYLSKPFDAAMLLEALTPYQSAAETSGEMLSEGQPVDPSYAEAAGGAPYEEAYGAQDSTYAAYEDTAGAVYDMGSAYAGNEANAVQGYDMTSMTPDEAAAGVQGYYEDAGAGLDMAPAADAPYEAAVAPAAEAVYGEDTGMAAGQAYGEPVQGYEDYSAGVSEAAAYDPQAYSEGAQGYEGYETGTQEAAAYDMQTYGETAPEAGTDSSLALAAPVLTDTDSAYEPADPAAAEAYGSADMTAAEGQMYPDESQGYDLTGQEAVGYTEQDYPISEEALPADGQIYSAAYDDGAAAQAEPAAAEESAEVIAEAAAPEEAAAAEAVPSDGTDDMLAAEAAYADAGEVQEAEVIAEGEALAEGEVIAEAEVIPEGEIVAEGEVIQEAEAVPEAEAAAAASAESDPFFEETSNLGPEPEVTEISEDEIHEYAPIEIINFPEEPEAPAEIVEEPADAEPEPAAETDTDAAEISVQPEAAAVVETAPVVPAETPAQSAEIDALKASLAAVQAEACAAKADLETLKVELDCTRAELESAKADAAVQSAQLEEARAELEAARTESCAKAAEAEALKAEIDGLKADLNAAKADAESSGSAKEALEETQAALKTAQDDAAAQAALLDEIQAQLDASKAESEAKAGELDALKADNDRLKADLEAAQAEAGAKAAEAETLKAELTAAKADADSLEAGLDAVRAELAAAKSGGEAASAAPSSELQAQLDAANEKNRELEEQLAFSEERANRNFLKLQNDEQLRAKAQKALDVAMALLDAASRMPAIPAKGESSQGQALLDSIGVPAASADAQNGALPAQEGGEGAQAMTR